MQKTIRISNIEYKFIEELGKGGFGKVNKVLNLSNNKYYAMKVIPIKGETEKKIQSLEKEAEILSKFNCDNIVKYYGSSKDDDNIYILMEYCDGDNLRNFIDKNIKDQTLIQEDTLKNIVKQICKGIKEIHDKKIVHRDLKPENIFINKNMNIKIGDFGISKQFDSYKTHITKYRLGTEYYIAPEIIKEGIYNNKSDIWSLGCIIYELFNLSIYHNDKLLDEVKSINSDAYNNKWQILIDSLLEKDYKKRFDINQVNQFLENELNIIFNIKISEICVEKNYPISEEDLKLIFEKYPPLQDGVAVELRQSFEYEEVAIYYGEWEKSGNRRHGRGIQVWKDGSRYEGYWIEDKGNNKGKLVNPNGSIYEGEWLDDKPHGYGVYTHFDGTKYEGYWKEDKQDGKGKESWPDGSSYEGDYKQGKKSGKGIFKFADGSSYEGDFEDNNINGKGIYIFGDGRQYVGDWKNNRLDGKGVFTWPDGRRYEGEYKDDKKEGYGIFEWTNGKKYRGYWHNGKQNGEGELYNNVTKQWKRCLFQNGKIIRWLD